MNNVEKLKISSPKVESEIYSELESHKHEKIIEHLPQQTV